MGHMAKIMVTGATGLLGRAVVKQLELTGHEALTQSSGALAALGLTL